MHGTPDGRDSATRSRIDWPTGNLQGFSIRSSVKKLGQLEGVFLNHEEWLAAASETIVYSVQWHEGVPPETEGGVFWGSTTIQAGTVGDEYFMTRGHFHRKRDRAEYYCTAQGNGMLLLMDEAGLTRVEVMSPGSLHYIPGFVAHRTVNTGSTPFTFWACWPSDAGHDYEAIDRQPFTARVLQRNGEPEVVWNEPILESRQPVEERPGAPGQSA